MENMVVFDVDRASSAVAYIGLDLVSLQCAIVYKSNKNHAYIYDGVEKSIITPVLFGHASIGTFAGRMKKIALNSKPVNVLYDKNELLINHDGYIVKSPIVDIDMLRNSDKDLSKFITMTLMENRFNPIKVMAFNDLTIQTSSDNRSYAW